jgi:5'-nucleotidase
MSAIEWIGFDMDYTLAIYRQEAMDALSIELTIAGLVEHRGYPRRLLTLTPETEYPIRGLLIDRRLGHVLKMDRFGAIHKGYHGFSRLGRSELRELYWDRKVRTTEPRFHWIDTLFSLSEVTTYATVLDALEADGQTVNYEQLFQDIRHAIDGAHADGTVHRRVLQDLPKYIDRDPELPATLHKLRSAGKKLFLVTNSPWEYTDAMMKYLLDRALPQYRNWTMYFNVVNVFARKPLWFQGQQPYYLRQDGERVSEVNALERGKVYEGGNREDFERLTGAAGSRTIYIGDHIYGDILRSKKDSAWRTAMIIQELDQEFAALRLSSEQVSEKLELEARKLHLDDEVRYYQRRLKELQSNGAGDSDAEAIRVKAALDETRRGVREFDARFDELEERIDALHHKYWGSLLKEGGELSSFGAQVERYADLYMRRVSCLRHYSPEQFFRSPHDFMPHEL